MIGCLCIHGYSGGPYEVGPLAAYLKENTDWEVKVPTLPGHGKKLHLKGKMYQEWIREAETAFLELQDKCSEIYLVGFSMGGMIAAYLAAKYPVRKLVMLSPSVKYLNIKQMVIEIRGFVVKGAANELKHDELYENWKSKRGSLPVSSMIEFQKCIRFTRPYLKKVKCPVLIIQGRQDSLVPPLKSAFFIEEHIPVDPAMVLFDQSNHHICLGKDKEAIIRTVSNFLLKEKETA